MSILVRRFFVAVALLVCFGLGSADAEPIKIEGKDKSGRVLLNYTVDVRPSDPFHESNIAGKTPTPMKGVTRGETFLIVIQGAPVKGFHTYPITRRSEQQDEASLSSLEYGKNAEMTPLFPVEESAPEWVDTKVDGIWLEHEKPFTWTQEVYVDPQAKPGLHEFQMTVTTQLCNDQGCTWFSTPLTIPVTILPDAPLQPSPALQKRLELKTPPTPTIVPVPSNEKPAVNGDTPAVNASTGSSGLIAFVLQGMFWGIVSLITPCVFPMIPITVSYFLKQAESNKHSALKLATVYTLTVVIVLTIAAVALLSVFRELSTWWVTNAFLGALFIFFALSLFGLYDIELPGWLSNFTSSREGQGGIVGTIFMALTFTIISFACVAPFLGGFGGTAAGSGLTFWHRLAGGFAFAATFAAPFFVLALFPSLLKALPKSGAWMNSVKVVMGFLELAAAIKFFRQSEIDVQEPVFFTYEMVMASYVAISFLCGLYLLGAYHLHHDTPTKEISVSGLLVGFLFFGLGLYLMPALFKTYNANGERTYPSGVVFAWIDSFMLPDTSAEATRPTSVPGSSPSHNETWMGNLTKALSLSKETGKPVFVDFTGVTCTNCKINERSVFSRQEIRDLFSKYVLVQLYTDRIPDPFYSANDMPGSPATRKPDAKKNLEFQREKFNTEQLPLYVVLKPDSTGNPGSYHEAAWLPETGYQELGRYTEGKINDVGAFRAFLEQFSQ